MVYGRQPVGRGPMAGGFGGLTGPVPPDVWILLAVVFGTFSIDTLTRGALLPLRLGSWVWMKGWVWQLVTYPLIGDFQLSLWLIVELVILFWFGKDVFWRLGRKRFWRTLAWAAIGGGLVAVAVDPLLRLVGLGGLVAWSDLMAAVPYPIIQGQRILMTALIAAFAALFADATIYLFFVLPVRARWFVWIEILFAFIAFLRTRDLPGFLGLCAAVGITWMVIRHGGPGRGLRRTWLRWRQRRLEHQLERERRKRGFRVVRGGDGQVH